MDTRKILLSGILLVIFLFVFSTIRAQDDLSWAGAWQYGPSSSVESDTLRDLAFLASGGAVLIVDMTDPAEPQLIYDDIRTRGLVMDIHYDYGNENLWLACNEAGLEVWDVSDVNNPVFVSNTEILYSGVETPVEQVEQYQEFAILECSWGYIQSVDMSDPANPVQAGFNGSMGNPARDISVTDNGYVHSIGAQYYVLLEINPDGSLSGSPGFDPGASRVFGRTTELVYFNTGSLYIYNRTNGQSSVTDVDFDEIIVRDDMAYMIGDEIFMIYDVSDFLNPQFVSSTSVSGPTTEFTLHGNYAYIATNYDGLRVVDFSDIQNPMEISHHEGTHVSWKSEVQGDYAFLANSGSGLSIIDISDPYTTGPVKVGGIASENETRDVAVEGNTAFVADYSAGLRMIDVSDPANPSEINRIEGFNAWRVIKSGDFLYVDEAVPNMADTLRIYDISDLQNPQMLSKMTLNDLIWELELQGDYLYVPGNDDGVMIIDVSDEANPVEVATIDFLNSWDISFQGDMAFLASADWEGGLVTLDISDPTDPQVINVYNPSGWYHPSKLSVEGNFAFTGELFGQVRLFDISNPAAPVELDEYVTSGSLSHLLAMDNFLYISDISDGLQILQNGLYTGISKNNDGAPEDFSFYPNPMTDHGIFRFRLAQSDQLQLQIFNLVGQELFVIETGHLGRGLNEIYLNAADIPGRGPGLIFYRLSGSSIEKSGKILIR